MARNPWGHRRFSMTVLALGVLLALPAYHWRSRYLFAIAFLLIAAGIVTADVSGPDDPV